MDRLKRQAERNREAAKVLRSRGRDEAAARVDARAVDLESGRVTDVTDTVIGLYRWAQGR
ncbi:hypothetical protein ACFU3E_32470 [Streptomyces sp. NPDC057424]|uniref:hypothetical protein n=1 Tax=Streptomyces sp. NPDC057424 TaxID=3346127 RepID=UPI0036AAC111